MTGQIEGHPVRFLVDTGATITLVSTRVYSKLLGSPLQPVDFTVYQADGEPMSTKGHLTCKISLGPLQVLQDVVVADLQEDAILGMDFLLSHDCKLDLVEQKMQIQDISVTLWNIHDIGSFYKVTMTEDGHVPGKHEAIIAGRLQLRGQPHEHSLLEGTTGLTEKYGLLVAPALIDPREQIVRIRVLNPHDEDVYLREGTTVGTCQNVEVWETSPIDNLATEVNQQIAHITVKNDPLPDGCVPEYLTDLLQRSSKHVDEIQTTKLKSLLCEYADIFAKNDRDLGRTDKVKHHINTGDARPVKIPPRRVPLHLRDEMRKQTEDMLKSDIIEPSCSAWSSPVVLVKKKDNTSRYCIDYRRVNDVCQKDAKSIPHIQDNLPFLAGAKFFSTIDYQNGFWQIEMDPDDRHKTAFSTPDGGLYQFKVMPFGLCNSLGTFERLVEEIFSGLQYRILLLYLDDILIHGSTFDEQLERLKIVFDRIRESKMKLKPEGSYLSWAFSFRERRHY